MQILYGRIGEPEKRVFDQAVDIVRIGSDSSNNIVLNNPYVSAKQAVLSRNGANWELTNIGENEILIGAQRLRPSERAVITGSEPIQIFPFLLSFESDGISLVGQELDERISSLILDVHSRLLELMPEPALTRDQLLMLRKDNVCSIEGFMELTGERPVAFEDGLRYLEE